MSTYSFGAGLPTYNGVPMVGGFPMGLTETFFVDYGNGSDGVSKKANSVSRPWKTLDKANDNVTTNKNEGIALMGNSTHTLTEMLTVAKNRVHIFGYDPGGRSYGQNAKISLGVTTDATDTATIRNTGVRNSFSNVKVMNSNTKAEALHAFEDGGEYTVMASCEIYKSSLLTTNLTAELLCNGDSSQYNNCTFGDLVNSRGGSGVERPNVKLDRTTIAGKVARDVTFANCTFLHKAADTDACFVYGHNATDVERRMVFINPVFWNCVLAAATPADAVNFAAAQTQGDVLLMNPVGINVTALAGASLNVYVQGPVPTAGTTGIAVEVAA
jgi:hypothetical protein